MKALYFLVCKSRLAPGWGWISGPKEDQSSGLSGKAWRVQTWLLRGQDLGALPVLCSGLGRAACLKLHETCVLGKPIPGRTMRVGTRQTH